MADYYRLHAVDCAKRAALRAAAKLHLELGRGKTSLQAIAWTAPLIGAFGATASLMDALRHYSPCGECASGWSEFLVPFALSLPIAIFAFGGCHYLRHQIEIFDLEMGTATLDLLNDLARLNSGRRPTT